MWVLDMELMSPGLTANFVTCSVIPPAPFVPGMELGSPGLVTRAFSPTPKQSFSTEVVAHWIVGLHD